MPVYFIGYQGTEGCLIKIGVAKDIRRRRIQLQTGSPVTLEVMGWIQSRDDAALERSLHAKFKTHRERGEWFNLDPAQILPDLTRAGRHGFVAKNANAFEITGYDSDAVPEYMGVWKWGDFEYHECCPFCGCFCGMHYQEASCMYHCMNCDNLSEVRHVAINDDVSELFAPFGQKMKVFGRNRSKVCRILAHIVATDQVSRAMRQPLVLLAKIDHSKTL